MRWILCRIQGRKRGAYFRYVPLFRNEEAGAKDKQNWIISFSGALILYEAICVHGIYYDLETLSSDLTTAFSTTATKTQ